MLSIEESCSLLGIADIDELINIDESLLKKRYRKGMVKYHPDSPNGDTEKAVELTEAYKIVTNAIKRVKTIAVQSKKEQVTAVIDLKKLIKAFDGSTLKIRKADKTVELAKKDLINNNVYILVDASVIVSGVEFNFSEMNNYSLYNKYKCDCSIVQESLDEPLEITVKCCNKSISVTMRSRSMEIPILIDHDIRVTVYVERKLVDENKNKS